jgi:hypothetical protein
MRYLTNSEMGIKSQARDPRSRMTTGKYKGWYVTDVPRPYLEWYHENAMNGRDHSRVELELYHRNRYRG